MTTGTVQVERYAAFTDDPDGGNPAGVVLNAAHVPPFQMQRIASEIGYSETAFVTGPIGRHVPIPIRYFAPEGEVDFCGHATIATAVAIGATVGLGAYTLSTNVGPVGIVARLDGTRTIGSLRSPAVDCFPLEQGLLPQLLDGLHWSVQDLDPDLPPAVGFGGNLQRLCREHNWVTLQLVAAVGPGQWRARDPFPWGGVVEDPATGAAAAAFAGYLRSLGRVTSGDSFVITQGVEMGRPGRIEVELLDAAALVSGAAARIEAP
jgi:predicted PhzF superfamily epimerase YddE/YHI9